MARTLGKLVISIGASTSLFERELAKASTTIKRWGRQATGTFDRTLASIDNRLNKTAKSIDRGFRDIGGTINEAINNIKIIGPAIKIATVAVGAFAASAAAIGAVTAAFNRLTEQVDFFAKTADRLGVGTEFLAGLRLGAIQAGLDMDRLNDNLRQFNTFLFTTQTAAEGAGGAGTGFEQAINRLGLSIENLRSLDTEARLTAVAESLSQIEDASEKAGIAVRIFGESGRDLVTLFADGESGIAAFVNEAERLGIAFSREELAKIEAARDSIAEIGLVVEAVSTQFLISFAPIFQTLADFWTQTGLTSNAVQGFMDAMAEGVAFAIHTIDNTVVNGFRVWFSLKAVVETVAAAVVDAWANVADGLSSIFSTIADGINRLTRFMVQSIEGQINALAGVADLLPGVNLGRVSLNAPQIGSVPGFGGASARGLATRIRAGRDISIAQVQEFEPTFERQRQQNLLAVPSAPPPGRGTLPPPPPPGGGGGGGGGRSGGAAADSEKATRDKEKAINDLERALQAAQKRVDELTTSFENQLASAMESTEIERFRLSLIEAESKRIDEQVDQFRAQLEATQSFNEAQMELNTLLEAGTITQETYLGTLKDLTTSQERYLAALMETDAIILQQETFEAISDITEDLTGQLRELLDAELQLQGAYVEQTAVEQALLAIRELDLELTEKQTAAIVKQATLIDMQREKLGQLEQSYQLFDQTNSILQNSTTALFGDLLDGVGTLGDAFGNFFNNLFNNLLSLTLNTAFGALFGGGGGGGGLGGLLGGLFGFAEGGMVPTTGPYLLHAGERVLNPREARTAVGGNSNIIINNNARGVSVSARQTPSGDREVIIQEAVSRSREAVRNDFVRSVGTGYGDYGESIQSSFQVNRRL